jgi:hypothetical protein
VEVPHRREEQDEPVLMLWDIGGLALHLDHEHGVALGIKVVEDSRVGVQLVAKDEHEFTVALCA